MNKPLEKGFIQTFEVKEVDLKSGFFKQAYTRYDVLDSDKERGRKGMFTKTWMENKSRIRHILNHDYTHPLGDPQKFYDEGDTAIMESQIGSHNEGKDFLMMVDSGLIKEASYGYNVIKSNKLKDGTTELLEVKLWEVSSLTGWGANEHTPVLAYQKGKSKSELFDEFTERYLALESFCHKSTATDNTLKKLELERDQIKSFLKTLLVQTGTEAEQEDVSLQPQLMKEDVLDTQIKGLLAQIEIQKQLLTA